MFLWEKQQQSWMRTWGGEDTKHPQHCCRGACSTKAGSSSWVCGRRGADPGGFPHRSSACTGRQEWCCRGGDGSGEPGACFLQPWGAGALSALTHSAHRLTKAGREAYEQRAMSNKSNSPKTGFYKASAYFRSITDSDCNDTAVWGFPHMHI